MATKKPTTGERLDQARLDLQNVEAQINEIETQRATALLGDDDARAVELDLQLVKLRAQARVLGDKAELLTEQIEQDKRDAAARQHEQHVREFEETLARADAAGDELQATVAKLEETFRETIRLRELALSMWPHGRSSHGDAAARAPDGCAMAAGAVATLLANEIHRVGFEAPLGGRPGEKVKVALPGGIPPRLTPEVDRRTGRPLPLVPLAEKLRAASKFAIATLREDLFVPPVVPQPSVPIQVLGVEQPRPAPVPAPTQTPAPVPAPSAGDTLQEYVPPVFREKLATLLRLQMRAAANGDDATYEKCVTDMVELRREIDAARDGEKAA
jgi:hypothetical protein